MTYKLPDLPYDKSALEPVIDAHTMALHHDKHHAAYVNNLNKAVENYPDVQERSPLSLIVNLDSVPEEIRTAVRNNGGGHVNHSMFWLCMSPNGGGAPSGSLGDAIDKQFGSFQDFQAALKNEAMDRFGSGWAWLCADSDGKLQVTSTANQDNPVMTGQIPLLGIDVWEHAYYLGYQNRRGDYIDAWWDVVDWSYVSSSYNLVRVGAKLDDLGDWASKQWSKVEEAWNKISGS
jgi:Fe-Mn family superoxide dismutase